VAGQHDHRHQVAAEQPPAAAYRTSDLDTRAQTLRLRAGLRASQLSSKRPTISPSGQLDVAGAITRRAKGVVRVQLDWVDGSDGSIGLVERRAIVRAPGRWGVRSQLPPGILTQIANRCSTVQANVLFTGFQPLRLRVRCARSRRCRSLETPRGGGAGGGDPAG